MLCLRQRYVDLITYKGVAKRELMLDILTINLHLHSYNNS